MDTNNYCFWLKCRKRSDYEFILTSKLTSLCLWSIDRWDRSKGYQSEDMDSGIVNWGLYFVCHQNLDNWGARNLLPSDHWLKYGSQRHSSVYTWLQDTGRDEEKRNDYPRECEILVLSVRRILQRFVWRQSKPRNLFL